MWGCLVWCAEHLGGTSKVMSLRRRRPPAAVRSASLLPTPAAEDAAGRAGADRTPSEAGVRSGELAEAPGGEEGEREGRGKSGGSEEGEASVVSEGQDWGSVSWGSNLMGAPEWAGTWPPKAGPKRRVLNMLATATLMVSPPL